MTHPACCPSPETCDLSYVEHLRGFVIGVDAMPSRAVNRTPGQRDEMATVTRERERRWDREHRAYRVLRDAGAEPPTLASAPRMLKELGG